MDTVRGVGRRKNELVGKLMAQRGVAAYEGSVRFLAAVRKAGLGLAVVTSSENAGAVLRAAGLGGAFNVQVDGVVARELAFPFSFHGRHLHVEITPASAMYELRSGAAVEIEHWGAPFTVTREDSFVRAIPPPPSIPALRQPPGRAPARRRGSTTARLDAQ